MAKIAIVEGSGTLLAVSLRVTVYPSANPPGSGTGIVTPTVKLVLPSTPVSVLVLPEARVLCSDLETIGRNSRSGQGFGAHHRQRAEGNGGSKAEF